MPTALFCVDHYLQAKLCTVLFIAWTFISLIAETATLNEMSWEFISMGSLSILYATITFTVCFKLGGDGLGEENTPAKILSLLQDITI